MIGLGSALTVFARLHSVPVLTAVRSQPVAAIGRGPSLVAYWTVSLAAIGWPFHEAIAADPSRAVADRQPAVT